MSEGAQAFGPELFVPDDDATTDPLLALDDTPGKVPLPCKDYSSVQGLHSAV